MSKYVREIDSIEGLRNTPTSDAAAAHVRTPTGQSGIFVPMDGDPFGRGDDGAVALQASDGTWWARKRALDGEARPEWWGAKADGQTYDGAALQSAFNFADENNTLLRVEGDGPYLTTQQLDFRPSGTNSPRIVSNGAQIKQADGANLDPVILLSTAGSATDHTAKVDINLDANRSNNADGNGIQFEFGRAHRVNLNAQNVRGTGVAVKGEVESCVIDVTSVSCVEGVRVSSPSGFGTPDENHVQVNGRENDTDVFLAGGTTGTVTAHTEAAKTFGIRCESGNWNVEGVVRGADNRAFFASESSTAIINFSGLKAVGGGIEIRSCTSISGQVTARNGSGPLLIVEETDNESRLGITLNSVLSEASGTRPAIRLGSVSNGRTVFGLTLRGNVDFNQSGGETVLFDNAKLCDVALDGATDGYDLSGADRCRLAIIKPSNDIVNANGGNSIIEYVRPVPDNERANIPTLVAGMHIQSNPDDNGLPNYYDGTNWVLPDGTTT